MTGGEKGTVLLDIDKQTLEKALSFESKTWPDFTAAEWDEKIDRYFAAYTAGVTSAATCGWECLDSATRTDSGKGVSNVCLTTNGRFDSCGLICA